MRRKERTALPRRPLLAALSLGALLALLATQVYSAGNVWVAFYYDDSGAVVGAESWGDCSIGSWGYRTANSTTQVYACDGEQPY